MSSNDFTETVWGRSPGIVTQRTPVNVGEENYIVYTGPRLIIVKRRSMILTSKGTHVPAWITVTNVDEISNVLDRMPR